MVFINSIISVSTNILIVPITISVRIWAIKALQLHPLMSLNTNPDHLSRTSLSESGTYEELTNVFSIQLLSSFVSSIKFSGSNLRRTTLVFSIL